MLAVGSSGGLSGAARNFAVYALEFWQHRSKTIYEVIYSSNDFAKPHCGVRQVRQCAAEAEQLTG